MRKTYNVILALIIQAFLGCTSYESIVTFRCLSISTRLSHSAYTIVVAVDDMEPFNLSSSRTDKKRDFCTIVSIHRVLEGAASHNSKYMCMKCVCIFVYLNK